MRRGKDRLTLSRSNLMILHIGAESFSNFPIGLIFVCCLGLLDFKRIKLSKTSKIILQVISVRIYLTKETTITPMYDLTIHWTTL